MDNFKFEIAIISQDDISVRANPCGSKTYVINLINNFVNKGIDVLYIGTISNPNHRIKHLSIKPITRKEISTTKFILALLIKSFFIKFSTNSIIHAQKPLELLPFIFKRHKKILTLHGPELKRVRFKKGKIFNLFYSIFEKKILEKADSIISVDKGTKDYYINEYPFLKHKISVIPIGIDTEKFKPINLETAREKLNLNNQDKIIIFIGRLEKEKNVKFLIDSFDIIRMKISQVKLLIIGKGNCENLLKSYVREKNISNVKFMGEVENELIPLYLAASNVLALCSIYEGSPTVIKEALACNTPVVSLNVGDVKDVLKKFKGSFISENNPNEFAINLIKVLSSKEKIDYSIPIKEFSFNTIAEKTLEIYKN